MAIRITRVYTRTGDKGETGLVGGKRTPKDSPRIEAYGTIDELNSIVGLARVFNEEKLADGDAHQFLDTVLRQIQDELFDLGSELATPPDFFQQGMYRVGEPEVKKIEQLIDECQKDLEPLKSFVLPGGGRIGAYLHQCRTVCRRAEREIVRLSRRRVKRMADKVRKSFERSFLRALSLDQQKDGQGRISLAARTRGESKK